jgi:hypothetical protein
VLCCAVLCCAEDNVNTFQFILHNLVLIKQKKGNQASTAFSSKLYPSDLCGVCERLCAVRVCVCVVCVYSVCGMCMCGMRV